MIRLATDISGLFHTKSFCWFAQQTPWLLKNWPLYVAVWKAIFDCAAFFEDKRANCLGGFSLADAAYLYLFTPGGQFPSPAKEASLEINNLSDDWNLSATARALQDRVEKHLKAEKSFSFQHFEAYVLHLSLLSLAFFFYQRIHFIWL